MKNNSRSVIKLVNENNSIISFTYNRSPVVYCNTLLMSLSKDRTSSTGSGVEGGVLWLEYQAFGFEFDLRHGYRNCFLFVS
jgi:hypothetical protein